MTIILTGSCGFVGSTLAAELLARVETLKIIEVEGYQVRDCLHPRDLGSVLSNQILNLPGPCVSNFGGGSKIVSRCGC